MATREELEVRLARAHAQVAELERDREARGELARLEADVLVAERRVRDEKAIAQAVADHGPIGVKLRVVETEIGVVILKRPHAAIFRRFVDEGSTKSKDLDKLVRPSVVYPDAATLDGLLEEQPAVLLELANAVSELAGARAREVAGK